MSTRTRDPAIAAVKMLADVLSECRTCITERWPMHSLRTVDLVAKLDTILSALHSVDEISDHQETPHVQ